MRKQETSCKVKMSTRSSTNGTADHEQVNSLAYKVLTSKTDYSEKYGQCITESVNIDHGITETNVEEGPVSAKSLLLKHDHSETLRPCFTERVQHTNNGENNMEVYSLSDKSLKLENIREYAKILKDDVVSENNYNISTKLQTNNAEVELNVIETTDDKKMKMVDKVDHVMKTNPVEKEDAPKNSKVYSCHVCGKTMRGNFRDHLRIHSGEKPHICDICGRSFIKSSGLKTHMMWHTGEKPFKCEYCGTAFRQVCALNAHIRIHTGDRPYKCDICHRCFSEASTLKRHMRTHTKEQPYSCDVCQKRFNKNGNLIRHKLTHTGEKSFSCVICSKSFAQLVNLKSHISLHSNERPHSCKHCEKSFVQARHLKDHIKKHHYEEDVEMSS